MRSLREILRRLAGFLTRGRREEDEDEPRPRIHFAINTAAQDPGEFFSPPSGEARVTYGKLISQVAKRGKGITPEDQRIAKALAEEIESDNPHGASVRLWSERLGLELRWLPWKRTPGPGEGVPMKTRLNRGLLTDVND